MSKVSVALKRSTRQERGIALFRERGEEIEHHGRGRFSVPGCSGEAYEVNLAIFSSDEQSCTCPDHPPIGKVCKHIYAATIVRAKRQAAERRKHSRRVEFSPEQVAANLARMGA